MELEQIHVTVLALTALLIVYSDHEGVAYLRGKKPTLNPTVTQWLHRGVTAGLSGMVLSGFLLFWPARDYYLTEPEFLVKLLMVAALIANGYLIGKLSPVASQTPFAELPLKTKRRLLISGAVSGFCWLGAAFIGFSYCKARITR
jgi:hypothetical protein